MTAPVKVSLVPSPSFFACASQEGMLRVGGGGGGGGGGKGLASTVYGFCETQDIRHNNGQVKV